MYDEFKLNKQERRIIFLSCLGGALELYDFILYGFFSVYFAPQFFPSSQPLVSIIQSYAVFALGYIARPIGGVIFSHIGDEYGRKKVLVLTIIFMAGASLGIGILPNYKQIGIIAPILLLLLRLIQGMAIGGELPSTYVYISESLPHKRGYAFGLVMVGVNCGVLVGIVINYALTHLLSHAQLLTFGWRIPFLLGSLIGLFSYKIRRVLHETPAFCNISNKAKVPLVYLLRNYLQQLISGVGLIAIMASLSMVGMLFMASYLHLIMRIDTQRIGYMLLMVMPINLLAIMVTGVFANRYCVKSIILVLIGLSLVIIPVSYCLFWLGSGTLLGLALLAMLEGVAAMIIPLTITSLFPAKIRLTGVGLCYNLGFTIFSGLAPIVISQLIKTGENIYVVPVGYLLVTVFISGISLFYVLKHRYLTINSI